MNLLDSYVQNVLRNVFATQKDKARLEADLRAHFAEAQERGETTGQIIHEMGKSEDVAAAFNVERDIRYADFWRRSVAFFGDCGLILALILPLLSLAILLMVRLSPGGEPSIGQIAALCLLATAICGILIFYFPILEARFGKTFGKHLLRIRVIRENGAPISLGQAFVRRLSLYFELLLPDALFVPFTDKRQRGLDIIAKTLVAEEPEEQVPGWAYAVCLLLPVVSLLALLGVGLLCAPA